MGTVLTDIERMHREEPKLEDQVQTVKRDLKKLGQVAGEDAKRKLVEVRSHGEEMLERVRDRSRRGLERRPLTWLAAAAGAGAGVMAALLWRRK